MTGTEDTFRVLHGTAIFLRQLRVDDVTEDYVEWMNDPEIVRFTESRFATHTMESTKDFVGRCLADPAIRLFGIFSRTPNQHIGNIKLGPINPHHASADIGLIIGRREFWGKGIATQVICLVRDHAFRELGIEKLTAGCYAGNEPSSRAFLRAGFTLEGTRRQQCRLDDQRVDVIELGLVKS